MEKFVYGQHLKKAIELKRDRQLDKAMIFFDEILSEGKDDAFFLSNLAHLYCLRKDYKRALNIIEKSIQIKTPTQFVKNLKVKILTELERNNEAEVSLHQLLQTEVDKETVKKLIKLYLKERRFKEALAQVNQSLECLGYDRDIMLLKGEILEKLDDKEGAESIFKLIIEQSPADEFAYARLITLKLEDKSADEVIHELEMIISIPSKSTNAYLRCPLAKAYKKKGRYQDAIREYQEAIKLKPDYLFAKKQLGFCFSKMKDYPFVIQTLAEVFAEDPEDTYVRTTLISAYKKAGRLSEAKELLNSILSRRPDQKQLWGILKRIETEL